MGGRTLILLDTHAALWMDQAIEDMGEAARSYADAALAVGELAISAISFWEIGMLFGKGRITLRLPPTDWRADILETGLEEIEVDGRIAVSAAELDQLHGDPADRLILATALAYDAQLMTADRQLLGWPGALERIDARR